MKKLVASLLAGATIGLSACQLFSEPTKTSATVQGTVTNRYTKQPVPGVAVSVTRNTYNFLGSTSHDSITSAVTDAQGRYGLQLDLASNRKYLANALYNQKYYDLTYQPYFSGESGAVIQPGTNQVDIEVTDYKLVTVNAASNKSGKSNIVFSYINAGTYYFSGDIFSDSVRANQTVHFTRVVKVLPNVKYNFIKLTVNRIGQGYSATYAGYVRDTVKRTVLYNDTTIINFR